MSATARASCLLVAAIGTAPALAQSDDYVAKGKQAASSKVKHKAYTFEVIAPYSVYEDIDWQRYQDRKDPGSTILVTGLGGYDSYALTVLTVVDPGTTDPLTLAQRKYPSISFAAHPTNPSCVVSDLSAAPQQMAPGMQAHFAECVDPKTGMAYELALSWRSMVMWVTGPDSPCRKAEDGGVRCPDREVPLREAMDRFVGSFRFRD